MDHLQINTGQEIDDLARKLSEYTEKLSALHTGQPEVTGADFNEKMKRIASLIDDVFDQKTATINAYKMTIQELSAEINLLRQKNEQLMAQASNVRNGRRKSGMHIGNNAQSPETLSFKEIQRLRPQTQNHSDLLVLNSSSKRPGKTADFNEPAFRQSFSIKSEPIDLSPKLTIYEKPANEEIKIEETEHNMISPSVENLSDITNTQDRRKSEPIQKDEEKSPTSFSFFNFLKKK